MRRGRVLAPILALLLAAAAATTAAASAARPPALPQPPASMLGMPVSSEDVSKAFAQGGRQQYLQQVQLWTIRDQGTKLLEATLQVGRLRNGAPSGSDSFQASVAGQIGSAVPLEERLGGTTVYITSINKLELAIWFRGPILYVLSVRNTYGTPKALIREALKIR